MANFSSAAASASVDALSISPISYLTSDSIFLMTSRSLSLCLRAFFCSAFYFASPAILSFILFLSSQLCFPLLICFVNLSLISLRASSCVTPCCSRMELASRRSAIIASDLTKSFFIELSCEFRFRLSSSVACFRSWDRRRVLEKFL